MAAAVDDAHVCDDQNTDLNTWRCLNTPVSPGRGAQNGFGVVGATATFDHREGLVGAMEDGTAQPAPQSPPIPHS